MLKDFVSSGAEVKSKRNRRLVALAGVGVATTSLYFIYVTELTEFPARPQSNSIEEVPVGDSKSEPDMVVDSTLVHSGGDEVEIYKSDSASSAYDGQEIDLEDSVVVDQSINIDFFLDPILAAETFHRLAEQFRKQSSLEGADQRATDEAIFYSQPQLSDGSVFVDLLECGQSICVAEFHANNPVLLEDFIEGIQTSNYFESLAFVELPNDDDDSGGMSQRLVYAHDPAINGITIPTDATIPIFFTDDVKDDSTR